MCRTGSSVSPDTLSASSVSPPLAPGAFNRPSTRAVISSECQMPRLLILSPVSPMNNRRRGSRFTMVVQTPIHPPNLSTIYHSSSRVVPCVLCVKGSLMMDPLCSETCWSTFKYFINLIMSTYYILCISWIIKCLIVIDARRKREKCGYMFQPVTWSSSGYSCT